MYPGAPIAIPNMPSPQVQTEYQLISAVADPFALDYLPLRRGGAVNNGSPIDFGLGGPGIIGRDFPPQDGTLGATPGAAGVPAVPAVGNINNGSPLLSVPPIRSIEWWHLTIWAQELIRDSTINPDFSGQSAVRAGRQVSMLKAKVTWVEFPSQPREILIDIGTGIDIFLGPTNQVFSVEIMIPNTAVAPPLRPGAFTTSATPAIPSEDPPKFRIDAWVVASAWCVYGSVGRPEGRFTQTAFASGSTSQLFVDIPIPDNARVLQVFSTQPNGNPPVIWGFENPVLPGAGTAPAIVPTPLGQFDFTGSQTGRVLVPQNSKFIRVGQGGDAALRTYTATFRGQQ